MPLVIAVIVFFIICAKLGITSEHLAFVWSVFLYGAVSILLLSLIMVGLEKFYFEPREIYKKEERRLAERDRPPLAGENYESRLRKRFEENLGAEIQRITLKRFFNTPAAEPTWQKMLEGIVKRDLSRHLSSEEFSLALKMLEEIKEGIENELTFPLFATRQVVSDSVSGKKLKNCLEDGSVVTGLQFEKWCRSALEHVGWRVEETSGSGDQGVDLIAWRNGTKVVVQCKHYSKTVGNSAVQEVIAGQVFYNASIGIVISSGTGFSASAARLADAAGVILLSGNEVFSMDEKIDFKN